MIYLLDVNVLIALMDSEHTFHGAARRWFTGVSDWATCPITENGVCRVLGGARYPAGPGSPGAVVAMLRQMRLRPTHHFWPDDVSLLDDRLIDAVRVSRSEQVTDTYLLALAVAHSGQLATFDRRLSTAGVHGGKAALHLIAG